MIQEQLINAFANFICVEVDEISSETNIFRKYPFNVIEIDELIEELNDLFEIEIDKDEFLELESVQEMAEYIEDIM